MTETAHDILPQTALRTLLAGAVDYAGLFPPANLDMSSVIHNYAAYRASQHAWALGRLIVPVARLAEFERASAGVARLGAEAWRLSVLAGSKLLQDVAEIGDFNRRQSAQSHPVAQIDTVEIKVTSVEEIEAASRNLPRTLNVYVEVPLEGNATALIAAMGRSGLRAKVRTGGVSVDAFPSSERLANFMIGCVAERIPFKATAGLHHPLRAPYRLTYQPDSAVCTMFGFLNMFLAAGIARRGGTAADVVAVLEERTPKALRITDDGISWRSYRLDVGCLSLVRNELFVSFGSCSFVEPIEGLQSLGLL